MFNILICGDEPTKAPSDDETVYNICYRR